MNILKDYKGLALVYVVITVISLFWVMGGTTPDNNVQANNETNNKVVINYENN